MTTFIGEYNCRIDAKGRLVLPSAFKKQMDPAALEKLVVKKDIFENCLVMYSMDEWTRQTELIRKKLNPYNREHNILLRGLYKGMEELKLDNLNRLLLPKRLLQQIGAGNEVVLLGQDNKIEIWSVDKFGKDEVGQDDFAALAERILGGSTQNEGEK